MNNSNNEGRIEEIKLADTENDVQFKVTLRRLEGGIHQMWLFFVWSILESAGISAHELYNRALDVYENNERADPRLIEALDENCMTISEFLAYVTYVKNELN